MTRKEYWALWQDDYTYLVWRCEVRAKELNSDGCTGVPDFYLPSCYEHDIAYRTGEGFIDEKQITRQEADERKKWHVQMLSWFGRCSPMAQWQYYYLRLRCRWSRGDWHGKLKHS